MDLKVALQDFETECKKIDNLVIMPNLNQRDVFNLLQPVIHQYLDIAKNTGANDPIFIKAQELLVNLAHKKSEFKDVIGSIVPIQEKARIDKKALVNLINSLIKEFKETKPDNLEKLTELQSKLNDCYQLIQDNKEIFTQEQFDKINTIMQTLFKQMEKTIPNDESKVANKTG